MALQLASQVELTSTFDFAQTVEQLSHAIANAGMQMFAVIDHAANALAAGLSMPATTVLIYGKAQGGTPIMLASPRSALDLPLHVLVREAPGGQVIVSFYPIAQILEASGVPAALASHLQPAQELLATAIAARQI